MDEITKSWLDKLKERYPRYAIILSHQFLDGTKIHECGFMPSEWNGITAYIYVK